MEDWLISLSIISSCIHLVVIEERVQGERGESMMEKREGVKKEQRKRLREDRVDRQNRREEGTKRKGEKSAGRKMTD